jgi:hypothetical protein
MGWQGREQIVSHLVLHAKQKKNVETTIGRVQKLKKGGQKPRKVPKWTETEKRAK